MSFSIKPELAQLIFVKSGKNLNVMKSLIRVVGCLNKMLAGGTDASYATGM